MRTRPDTRHAVRHAAALLLLATAWSRGGPADPAGPTAVLARGEDRPAAPAPAPAPALDGRRIQDAMARGVAYLEKAQRPDGGWVSEEYALGSPGHVNAITAVSLHALLVLPPDEARRKAVTSGLDFLEKNAPTLENGTVNHGFDFTVWGAAYGLLHLDGVKRRWPAGSTPPDMTALVDRYLAYAAKSVRKCGGWSYLHEHPDGRRSTDGSIPFLSACMAEGIRRWKPDSPLLGPAWKDLERCSAEEDRFVYSHDGDYATVPPRGVPVPREENAGRSLQAVLVLAEAGRLEFSRVAPKLDTFFEVREEFEKVRNAHPHTPPHMIAGYYYHHGHYYAARALEATASREPARRASLAPKVRALLTAMVAAQREDGAWIDAPCGGTPYGTALALLTLAAVKDLLFPWDGPPADALARAAENRRPVVILFHDGGARGDAMERELEDPSLDPVRANCTWIRIPKGESPDWWKAAGAGGGPTLVLLAPGSQDATKPAWRGTGKQKAETLLRQLKRL